LFGNDTGRVGNNVHTPERRRYDEAYRNTGNSYAYGRDAELNSHTRTNEYRRIEIANKSVKTTNTTFLSFYVEPVVNRIGIPKTDTLGIEN